MYPCSRQLGIKDSGSSFNSKIVNFSRGKVLGKTTVLTLWDVVTRIRCFGVNVMFLLSGLFVFRFLPYNNKQSLQLYKRPIFQFFSTVLTELFSWI